MNADAIVVAAIHNINCNAMFGINVRIRIDVSIKVNTKWHSATTPTVRFLLIPNFFIINFGQNTPMGDITSDDMKIHLSELGTGYNAWATSA